jgi:hypothetical protein
MKNTVEKLSSNKPRLVNDTAQHKFKALLPRALYSHPTAA